MIPVVSRLGLPRSLCLLLFFIKHMEQIELLSTSFQEAELRAIKEHNKHLQRKDLELVQDISIWILAFSIHEHSYQCSKISWRTWGLEATCSASNRLCELGIFCRGSGLSLHLSSHSFSPPRPLDNMTHRKMCWGL